MQQSESNSTGTLAFGWGGGLPEDLALRSLVDTGTPRRGHQDDLFLRRVREHLPREEGHATMGDPCKDRKNDRWHCPQKQHQC